MTRNVAIVIPTLNEERWIGGLLEQLSAHGGQSVMQILVADGQSTDGTHAIVRAWAARDGRIQLIDNPGRLQAAGVNRAVAMCDPVVDTIIRIDAHAAYPNDYVPRLLAVMKESGADMVAVRLETAGDTCVQHGIAAASNSRFGTGGAAHRIGGWSGFVDHGHHAAMDRRMFLVAGGYDESFAANEDAELDVRVRRAGGRIWLAGEICVGYVPRDSLHRLAVQYFRYGSGRARTMLKHRERLRLRQLAPPLLVVMLAGAIALAPVASWLLWIPIAYLALIAVATMVLWADDRQACTLAAGPAMATMHLAWGLGFLATLAAGSKGRRE